MNAIPVMTLSAVFSWTPHSQCRTNAWMKKPPIQPTISATRLVSMVLSTVPETRMTIGMNRRKEELAHAENMYGGAMLIQRANSNRQTLMPRLDGFMKWRILPAIGARNMYFELTATHTPNMIGQNWLLAYRSILTASAVMCAGSRNSYRPRSPLPRYSGRRL